MADGVCKFCRSPWNKEWRGQVLAFMCGSRPSSKKPETLDCCIGFVVKLQERIAALEALANKPKARTVREMAIQGGWHPEIKSPV